MKLESWFGCGILINQHHRGIWGCYCLFEQDKQLHKHNHHLQVCKCEGYTFLTCVVHSVLPSHDLHFNYFNTATCLCIYMRLCGCLCLCECLCMFMHFCWGMLTKRFERAQNKFWALCSLQVNISELTGARLYDQLVSVSARLFFSSCSGFWALKITRGCLPSVFD